MDMSEGRLRLSSLETDWDVCTCAEEGCKWGAKNDEEAATQEEKGKAQRRFMDVMKEDIQMVSVTQEGGRGAPVVTLKKGQQIEVQVKDYSWRM